MHEIERALREQIAHGPRHTPVPPTEAVGAGQESARIRLLMALTDDEAVHAEWARSVEYGEQDLFGKAAWLRAELDRVDDRVDELLEDQDVREPLELLARCEIPWRHDAIGVAVDEDRTRPAAALILAESTPGELRRGLMGCEVLADVVVMMRAAALAGADQLWDQFLIWRDRVEELEEVDETERERWLRRLDGVGAALDPTLFARGLLSGDYGTGWLKEARSVADFLQVYGPSDWLEVVAAIDLADGEEFELASAFAAAAAHGIGEDPPGEDEVERLLELLGEELKPNQKESPWETLATRSGLGFELALAGEEEEFGLSLAQTAAHERLVTHGIHSPGIRGLPLSTTSEKHLDGERVRELVEEMAAGATEIEALLVSAVRTIFDGVVWARRSGEAYEELLRDVDRAFAETTHGAVELAWARLEDELEPARREWDAAQFEKETTLAEALVLSAIPDGDEIDLDRSALVETLAEGVENREGPLGLDCARHLADVAGEESIERLGRLWLRDAPVLRAPLVRRALEDAIATSVAAE